MSPVISQPEAALHGVLPSSGHPIVGCRSLQHVNLRASAPQVVAQDVVFPENVDVSLQDIGGLEPVEDILVNQRMPNCVQDSMSSAGTWALKFFKCADTMPLGSLQKTKVLLPLQRPDLFQSNLLRLNKGILLYGDQTHDLQRPVALLICAVHAVAVCSNL